jgi:tRNA (Thr-GGU) A37 N-methylase
MVRPRRASAVVVKPFLDEHEHGVFATRAPCRPNAIGLSCVRLLGVDGGRLRISDVDVLEGTPLLDIKPYAPSLDCFHVGRAGWLQNKGGHAVGADDRFECKAKARRQA